MKKIINITIVVLLFLGVFLTINLVFSQNTKIIENLPANAQTKDMAKLTINNDLQKYGIEIISSTSDNFDSELKQYIGNEDSLFALVESTKPLAFFIKNNSSKEIVGISLRWQFTDSNGKTFEIPQSQSNPGVLMGMKPLNPKMRGKTSLINSKAIKFFTYFNDTVGQRIASANRHFKNPSANFRTPTNPTQSEVFNVNSQKEKILSSYANFSVSIDGIVFNDGTFIGANQNFFFDTLKGTIQARKDFLTILAEAKSLGKESKQALDDILSKTLNAAMNLAELRADKTTPEKEFDYSYKSYLKNLREELIMKRSNLSDDQIVEQFQLSRLSDIITLRKVEDSSK